MQILEEKKLKNSIVEMVIEVPESRIEVEFKAVFDHIAKNAKVDGFRKGKAPLKLVEKMFEKEAKREVLENVLKSTSIEAIEGKNYRPVSLPTYDMETFERGKPLKYTVRFETLPTVNLGSYKGISVKERACQVRDEDVEKEIHDLREKYAKISKKGEGALIEKGDLLRFGVKRIDNVKPEEAEALAFKEYTIIVGKSESEYALDKHVLGLSVGQTKEVTIKYPKDYEVKDLAGQKVTYVVKIEDISKMDLPNPDDEFAKDVSDFATIAELRQNIRSYFEGTSAGIAKSESMRAIKKAVIEKSDFDLSESLVRSEEADFLERFANRFNVQASTVEEFCAKTGFPEKEFRDMIRSIAEEEVKWKYARLEIAKKENIAISDEEYCAEVESMSPEERANLEDFERRIGQNEVRAMIKERMVLEKVNDFLYANAKVDKMKPVSYTEFMKDKSKSE